MRFAKVAYECERILDRSRKQSRRVELEELCKQDTKQVPSSLIVKVERYSAAIARRNFIAAGVECFSAAQMLITERIPMIESGRCLILSER